MASKTLTAVFKAVDQMSNVMDKVANGGEKITKSMDKAGAAANQTFGNLSSNSDKAAQAIGKTGDASEKAAQKMVRHEEKAKAIAVSSNELSDAGTKAAKAITENADAAEDAAKELGKMADELENVGDGLEDIKNKPGVTGNVPNMPGAPPNIPNTPSTMPDIPQGVSDSTLQSFGELESLLAGAGIALSLTAIGVAFMEAGRAAGEFETRIAAIATVADTSQASIGQITSDIMTLSRDTGQSAIELGQATYEAISASVDTANAVSFVADANKLAVGGFTSAAMATDVLTTTLNAYSLEAEEASRISDILITTQNLGKTVVDDLAQSMGRVIPTAAAFNVDMENLSSAFAITTSNGIKTAEAGTYINQMLVELGMASSNVSGVLMDETGMAFAQLMEQGNSLGDVLQIIKDSVDGDTTAFRNLWGSATAGAAALSLLNGGSEKYNSTLGAMQNSAGATSKAYKIMASTTEFAAKKAANSFENLKLSLGQGFNSLMNPIYEVGSAAMDALSGFMNEYPAVSQAITVLAIGFGTATTAITLYTVVTKIATAATGAFGASLSMIFWPVAIISGLVAGMLTLAGSVETVDNAYGSASESMQEFIDETNKTAEAQIEARGAFEEKITAMGDEEQSVLSLMNKLEELGNKAVKTAADQDQMVAIANKIIGVYPQMANVIDAATGTFKSSGQSARDYAKSISEAQKYQAKMDELVRLSGQEEGLEAKRDSSYANYRRKLDEYNNAIDDLNNRLNSGQIDGRMYEGFLLQLEPLRNEVDSLNEAYQTNTKTYEDNQDAIVNLSGELDGYNTKVESATAAQDALTQGQIKANEALSGVSANVMAAAEAYDQAYSSICSNLRNAFGLMEEVDLKSDVIAEGLAKAWGEQATAFAEYEANMLRASQLGLSDDVVARFSGGTKEDMANIKALVDDLDSVAAKGGDATGTIDSLNSTLAGWSDRVKSSGDTAADFASGFSKAMDDAKQAMIDNIDGMTLPDDAYTAATTTMNGYIQAIKDAKKGAVEQAQSIADAVNRILSGAGVNVGGEVGGNVKTGVAVAGNALGTTNAENVFVAGEQGPELIVGHQGSTVFPTSETDRIISALGNREFNVAPSGGFAASAQSEPVTVTNNNNKVITLNLQGGGKISVPRGASKKEILAIMQDNIRPVLIDLLEEELFTEGDGTYDY